MPAELRRDATLPFRQCNPDEESRCPVVLLHGYPESSLMWEPVMERLAEQGRRCIAPDLYGLGDSPDAESATFEATLAAFTRFMDEVDAERVVVVVHDWGGFIGLAWACDHPDRTAGLVIANTGFFSDGKWHGMAEVMRGPEGESVIESFDRASFGGLLASFGDAFDESEIEAYWRPFEDGRGQRATLDFYRSMDFEKLEPWQGKLAEIGAPTLILWGEDDQFAPIAGARRLQGEIPSSELVAYEGVGHFLFDEAEDRSAEEVARFLAEVE